MRYTRDQLINQIVNAASGIGFPPQIAVAQLARESANFRDDVVYGPFVAGAGEKGVAQFTPGTWARFGSGDPYDPDNSLAAWQRYIQYLRGLFGEDYTRILQGYNGGEGNVQRNTVSSAARRYASEVLAAAGNVNPAAGGSVSTDIFGDEWDWKKWAAIGLLGLLVVVAIND